MQTALLHSFKKVEKFARVSKLRRLLHSPYKYLYAILFRKLWLPLTNKSSLIQVDSFMDRKLWIPFPSGTDIYLSGGKTDDAEIRLTKFLLHNLSQDSFFIDIGAHIGYYSLLANSCGVQKILAVEPSPESYRMLEMNTHGLLNIVLLHKAVAEKEGTQLIHTFPHRYSEYDTLYPEQFQKQRWFSNVKMDVVEVESITLDNMLTSSSEKIIFIKIDAEGAEYDIIQGGIQSLRNQSGITIMMEYIAGTRDNTPHKKAVALLQQYEFNSYLIDNNGRLIGCHNIEDHMQHHKLTSDNIVFVRNKY